MRLLNAILATLCACTVDDVDGLNSTTTASSSPGTAAELSERSDGGSSRGNDSKLQHPLDGGKHRVDAATTVLVEHGDDSDAGEIVRAVGSDDLDAASVVRRGLAFAVEETDALAPFAGRLYTPAGGQEEIGFWGTDLGISVVRDDRLWFVFGDTWKNERRELLEPGNDDTQASLRLLDFPVGAEVDAWIERARTQSPLPPWQVPGPPIEFLVAGDKVAPIRATNGARDVPLGIARTPVAAFSSSAGLFMQFLQLAPHACTAGCPRGTECDESLGTPLGADTEMVCLMGTDLGCVAGDAGGYCVDPQSSARGLPGDVTGRRLSAVYRHEFGRQKPEQPGHYDTTTLLTNRFISTAWWPVRSYLPGELGGDYATPTPAEEQLSSRVFVWGRPWFIGDGATGRSAKMYFAYFDLPQQHQPLELPEFHYFSGLENGAPQFATDETAAAPLDLSGPGHDPTAEHWDFAGQHSMVWVPEVGRWLMIYGGDLTDLPVLVMGHDPGRPSHDPEGAIHIRVAEHPWGPWSAPQQLLRATNSDGTPYGLRSAPYGIVRNPTVDCSDAACPPHEAGHADDEVGFLYGAAVVPPWTTVVVDDHAFSVTIYWLVSTWDPYQVVLMRSALRFPR